MSVWTERIDSLNDQYKKLEKVLSELNDLKARAEDTWYIDPKGSDNANRLKTISRNLTEIKEKIARDFEEIKELDSLAIDLPSNDKEKMETIGSRILVLARSIETKLDQTQSAIKDNLFVELQEIFQVIATELKGIIKTISVNLQKTAKGLLEGNSGFRLLLPPGW